MSWFCQGITEDGRLCWLPKDHADTTCQSAPMVDYPIPVSDPWIDRPGGPVMTLDLPRTKDGAVQLPLPGL